MGEIILAQECENKIDRYFSNIFKINESIKNKMAQDWDHIFESLPKFPFLLTHYLYEHMEALLCKYSNSFTSRLLGLGGTIYI